MADRTGEVDVAFSSKAPAPIGPYSQATLCEGWLFVSGQLAINPATGKYTPSSVENETELVMQHLLAILHEAGADWKNVLKCSIFLKNMADFPKVNEVYARYFHTHKPARETVQVSALPLNAQVEISCVARVR